MLRGGRACGRCLHLTSPMVRVWKPKPIGKATLTAPWNLRRYDFAFSRRIASEVCIFVCPLRNRRRREDRVLAAPAVSRAICANQRAHEHTGQRETLRPSLRNGFTAYNVLSPENGSFASVAR